MNKIVKEKIKQAFLLFIIIISFVCVLAIMLKYERYTKWRKERFWYAY